MNLDVRLDGLPGKFSGYLHAVILPRRNYRIDDTLPPISVRRRDAVFDSRHLDRFRRLCGYEQAAFIPFVYPLMICFHYHLGVFAHPAFPWSLRRLLGLRNHVVQHRRISEGEVLDIAVAARGMHLRPKGVEIDLETVISSEGDTLWESTHVYFLRATVPDALIQPDRHALPALGSVELEDNWRAPRGGGLEFGRLSGDLNPVHYFTPWAKALGFPRAFCHTQRVITDCLRRLPEATAIDEKESLNLDVAFKGPVYYGNELTLRSAIVDGGRRFNLHCGSDERPAIAGHLRMS